MAELKPVTIGKYLKIPFKSIGKQYNIVRKNKLFYLITFEVGEKTYRI